MCILQPTGIGVVLCVKHQGSRVFPTWKYMHHIFRLSVIWHIFRDPVYGPIEDYNVCLNPTHRVVQCVVQKMEMQETFLCHKTILHFLLSHRLYIYHATRYLSISGCCTSKMFLSIQFINPRIQNYPCLNKLLYYQSGFF